MEIHQPGIDESNTVTSINTLTGDVILAAGSNITLTPVGNTITISATGGGTVGPGIQNEIAYFNTTTSIASLTTATYPSLTELSYVKGVTSAIQTEFTGKANTALSNLASVAINTSLISDTNNTDDLGAKQLAWANGYFNSIAVNPFRYSTGTASQSGTTITGVGTVWTAAMIGSRFIFADGTDAGTITARASNTGITVSTNQTVASQNYIINYSGLFVDSVGSLGIGTITPGQTLSVVGNMSIVNTPGVPGNTPGLINIYKFSPSIGDVLFSVGSNQAADQFLVKDRTLVTFSNGIRAGNLNMGASGGTYRVWSIQDGNNYLELATAGGGNTTLSYSTGANVLFKINNSTTVATLDGSGRLGIGVTPTAVLHLKAETATASTAPIKFTAPAALLTAPEALTLGPAINGDYLNFTTTTGTIRRVIVAGSSGRATAQTAANASVAAYTLGATDASYEVSANVLVTTSSAENFTVTVAYTDEGNTARTLTLNFQTIAGVIGTAINFANGAVPYEGVLVHLRCKASTAITIATVGTFTGATYNVEGIIKQIA